MLLPASRIKSSDAAIQRADEYGIRKRLIEQIIAPIRK